MPEHIFQTNTAYQSSIACGQKIAVSEVKFTAAAVMAGEYLFQMIREKKMVKVHKMIDAEIIERQSVRNRFVLFLQRFSVIF